jgi:hypothetical protein
VSGNALVRPIPAPEPARCGSVPPWVSRLWAAASRRKVTISLTTIVVRLSCLLLGFHLACWATKRGSSGLPRRSVAALGPSQADRQRARSVWDLDAHNYADHADEVLALRKALPRLGPGQPAPSTEHDSPVTGAASEAGDRSATELGGAGSGSGVEQRTRHDNSVGVRVDDDRVISSYRVLARQDGSVVAAIAASPHVNPY